jgi:ketosteroid isomerase-like protein
VFDMLDPVLERGDVKEALEVCNADMVWLRMYKKSRMAGIGKGVAMDKVPMGRKEWEFLKI